AFGFIIPGSPTGSNHAPTPSREWRRECRIESRPANTRCHVHLRCHCVTCRARATAGRCRTGWRRLAAPALFDPVGAVGRGLRLASVAARRRFLVARCGRALDLATWPGAAPDVAAVDSRPAVDRPLLAERIDVFWTAGRRRAAWRALSGIGLHRADGRAAL